MSYLVVLCLPPPPPPPETTPIRATVPRWTQPLSDGCTATTADRANMRPANESWNRAACSISPPLSLQPHTASCRRRRHLIRPSDRVVIGSTGGPHLWGQAGLPEAPEAARVNKWSNKAASGEDSAAGGAVGALLSPLKGKLWPTNRLDMETPARTSLPDSLVGETRGFACKKWCNSKERRMKKSKYIVFKYYSGIISWTYEGSQHHTSTAPPRGSSRVSRQDKDMLSLQWVLGPPGFSSRAGQCLEILQREATRRILSDVRETFSRGGVAAPRGYPSSLPNL